MKSFLGLSIAAFGVASLLMIGTAAAEHPCAQDAKKLCPNTKPGGGRVADCLKQHSDQLSAQCQEAINTKKGATQ